MFTFSIDSKSFDGSMCPGVIIELVVSWPTRPSGTNLIERDVLLGRAQVPRHAPVREEKWDTGSLSSD